MDLLEQTKQEIVQRIKELEPVAREYLELCQAAEVLGIGGERDLSKELGEQLGDIQTPGLRRIA